MGINVSYCNQRPVQKHRRSVAVFEQWILVVLMLRTLEVLYDHMIYINLAWKVYHARL
jgi:hypothetical protein